MIVVSLKFNERLLNKTTIFPAFQTASTIEVNKLIKKIVFVRFGILLSVFPAGRQTDR